MTTKKDAAGAAHTQHAGGQQQDPAQTGAQVQQLEQAWQQCQQKHRQVHQATPAGAAPAGGTVEDVMAVLNVLVPLIISFFRNRQTTP